MGPSVSGSPNAPVEATPNSAVLPHGRKVVLPEYNAVDTFKDAILAMKLGESSSVLHALTGEGDRKGKGTTRKKATKVQTGKAERRKPGPSAPAEVDR